MLLLFVTWAGAQGKERPRVALVFQISLSHVSCSSTKSHTESEQRYICPRSLAPAAASSGHLEKSSNQKSL